LRAWAERYDAAALGAQQVRTLDATKLSYSFSPASLASSDTSFGQVIALEQSFQLGQTRLRRNAADASARSVAHQGAARRNELEHHALLLLAEYYATPKTR
jgi:hypothetical protein